MPGNWKEVKVTDVSGLCIKKRYRLDKDVHPRYFRWCEFSGMWAWTTEPGDVYYDSDHQDDLTIRTIVAEGCPLQVWEEGPEAATSEQSSEVEGQINPVLAVVERREIVASREDPERGTLIRSDYEGFIIGIPKHLIGCTVALMVVHPETGGRATKQEEEEVKG